VAIENPLLSRRGQHSPDAGCVLQVRSFFDKSEHTDMSPHPSDDHSSLAKRTAPEIPADLLSKWQIIVEAMAEVISVPAGLIMRLRGDVIEVCVSSQTVGNVYSVGEAEHFFGSGLYCERVISSDQRLLVPDALADPVWRNNPDVPRGMIAYLGFPICWPDQSPFGTICVLDTKANVFSRLYERLIAQFRDVIEHHLKLLSESGDQHDEASFAHTELAAALERSAAKLREAQAEVIRLQRQFTVAQFAGAVVHEMNQPLTAIQSSAAAALRWLSRPEPNIDAARHAIQRLEEVNRRAMDSVSGLRAVSRKAVINPVVLDIHAVLREVLDMARGETTHAQVQVELQLSTASRWIVGDRAQLHLLLHNLIRNAIDAMTDVKDRKREINISVRPPEGGKITIAVEDAGIGLEPQIEARMFQGSLTTKANGMGLGLMICRAVVDGHGGTIGGATRSDGLGARFAFTLPTTTRRVSAL
jgi:signal transduction histidine kinase